jgi:four helix bundle protein
MAKIRTHEELRVFQLAFGASMQIFEVSKEFPKEERYSLTDQIRRSSRSVCANLAEAFRKRKYPKYFVAKLLDCEGEVGGT